MKDKSSGLTVVELLIAIVVIAVLATIAIVAYNGIQQQAKQNLARSDIKKLNESIIAARISQDKTLSQITQSHQTYIHCFSKPTGTNLADIPKNDRCWVDYLDALEKISEASGGNVRSLVDPWGRPYLIDENEGTGGGSSCRQDRIALFTYPFVHSHFGTAHTVFVQNYLVYCI